MCDLLAIVYALYIYIVTTISINVHMEGSDLVFPKLLVLQEGTYAVHLQYFGVFHTTQCNNFDIDVASMYNTNRDEDICLILCLQLLSEYSYVYV